MGTDQYDELGWYEQRISIERDSQAKAITRSRRKIATRSRRRSSRPAPAAARSGGELMKVAILGRGAGHVSDRDPVREAARRPLDRF
jgi:hypothetical protein